MVELRLIACLSLRGPQEMGTSERLAFPNCLVLPELS